MSEQPNNQPRKMIKHMEEVITTTEHISNARHLYTTALHATKAYYAHQKKPTPASQKEMDRQMRLLHKALTRFNYGYDPLEKVGKK